MYRGFNSYAAWRIMRDILDDQDFFVGMAGPLPYGKTALDDRQQKLALQLKDHYTEVIENALSQTGVTWDIVQYELKEVDWLELAYKLMKDMLEE